MFVDKHGRVLLPVETSRSPDCSDQQKERTKQDLRTVLRHIHLGEVY